MLKWISILVLGLAIIAGAFAGVSVMNSREAIARANLQAAESREAAAKDEARKAQSEEKAAAAAENAAKANEAAAGQNLKVKIEEKEIARANEAKAKAESLAAQENRKAREAEAAKAADDKAAAQAEAEKAKAEAEKERAKADAELAKAQAEADKLARETLASEAVVAEARLWELKALDLVTMEQELNEYKRMLDERELALRPEKTIKDLVNIGDEGKEAAAEPGNTVLPEDDPGRLLGERALLRAERISGENLQQMLDKSSAISLARLEKLYYAALESKRPIDAGYYLTTIKSLYPDWEHKAQQNNEEQQEEEKAQ